MRQVSEIVQRVPASQLAVVDYHELVTRPDRTLRALYAFLNVSYRNECAGLFRADSLTKSLMIDSELRERIDQQCSPAYAAATLATQSRVPSEAQWA
jgi:hypothetical protein